MLTIIKSAKEITSSILLCLVSETCSDVDVKYPGKFDLTRLAGLCVVKLKNYTRYCDNLYNNPPPLLSLLSFFNSQANGLLALELFEISVKLVTDSTRLEYVITNSVHRWDKLDQNLASDRFPHLRQVNVVPTKLPTGSYTGLAVAMAPSTYRNPVRSVTSNDRLR